MEAHGLVVRTDRRYALAGRGRALRPVLHELVRWGAPLMESGPGDDLVDDRWAALAVEALLTSPAVPGPRATVELRCGATSLRVRTGPQGRTASAEPDDAEADAVVVVAGSLPELLAAVHAGEPVPGLTVEGDPALVRRALQQAPALDGP